MHAKTSRDNRFPTTLFLFGQNYYTTTDQNLTLLSSDLEVRERISSKLVRAGQSDPAFSPCFTRSSLDRRLARTLDIIMTDVKLGDEHTDLRLE